MKINAKRSVKKNSATARFAIPACGCAAAIAASTLLAGCNSASARVERADYTTTLNRYYQGRPMCLWPDSVTFPAEAAAPGQPDQRGFDALVDTGLLSRTRAGKGESQSSYIYDLTKEGHSALDRDIDHPSTGNFCYGRRQVVGIDSDRKHSTTTELVDFRYSVPHPASWATEVSVQRAFPQVAGELSGLHKAQAILLDTNQGWEVSGTPVPVAAAATHSPMLARAKALLRIHTRQTS